MRADARERFYGRRASVRRRKTSARDHIELWPSGWYSVPVANTAKVTVELPADLLARARRNTNRGITATIRQGLELVAAARAADELRALRGKVKFSINLHRLREDR